MTMIIPLTIVLLRVVSVAPQPTLLDGQCDTECRNEGEIQRLFVMLENMQRIVTDTNQRCENKVMELESKLADQKSIFEGKISNLTSQLSDQKSLFDDKMKLVDEELKDKADTIKLLQAEIAELASKNKTSSTDETSRMRDCEDIRALGYNVSGVYNVNVGDVLTKEVYCEMTVNGTAWTRILHRQDGLTDFSYKVWAEYEAGFGDTLGSHWLGLLHMHLLTAGRAYRMRVDLEDWEGETRYAEYSTFRVGPASDKYRLTVSGYSGTAGDSLNNPSSSGNHNNQQFSTIDQDNDSWEGVHCGFRSYAIGGWWYDACFMSCLTGRYTEGGELYNSNGIMWFTFRGPGYSYKVATMKLQRL